MIKQQNNQPDPVWISKVPILHIRQLIVFNSYNVLGFVDPSLEKMTICFSKNRRIQAEEDGAVKIMEAVEDGSQSGLWRWIQLVVGGYIVDLFIYIMDYQISWFVM